ncbi:MAG: type II toxin-antitoxin system HigB family toxin [Thermodesulfobacteriota bacterium]
MEVRGRKKLLEFMMPGDAKARKLFPAWLHDTETAEWKTPSDIKQRHRTADFLPGNRVIFNLGGNQYRIVTVIDYARQVVLVRWVGYHKDYDKINAAVI